MPCYAVYTTNRRHKSYIAFSAALVENWSELAMLGQMWPQLVTPRYDRTFCMTMDHFWPLSRLSVFLIEIWSNITESPITAQKWLSTDKYDPNLSYLHTVTNTGPLYATLELICTNLSQTAVNAITWYTRPWSLNSALKWSNSFKLDILDNSWPPVPTTGNTGSVDAILCSICH